jgi:hypothetical protein
MRNRLTDPPLPPPPLAPAQVPSTLRPLALRRLQASEVGPPAGQAAAVLSDAEATAQASRFVYTAAGLAWMAIIILALTLGMPASFRKWPLDAQFIWVYLQQGPPLFLLVWFLGIQLRAWLVIFGGYLLLGFLAVPIAPSFAHAATVANIFLGTTVLYPMAGLLLLLARPLRPWLLGFVAILLFLLTGATAGFLFGLDKLDMSDADPWWFVAGAIFPIAAIVFVGWLLPRARWRGPLAGLALLAATGLALANGLLPNYKVGPFSLSVLLVGLPGNVLEVMIVWLFFKAFMLLQERQFLPAQVLHSHLCWGFLTLYVWTQTFFYSEYQRWTPWVVLLAYALYLTVVHALLRMLWAARVGHPGKPLLLLRVFGQADQRVRLLDALEDTWRRIGRIDLIAGTDLAMRTLGSRMLEAFLLRRTDEQFLKTDDEVDRRLEQLHSRLEGDARYPINGVYCYASAWERAVTRLAPKSDAVLMDLRGFTSKNQGCVFELRWVVQHIPLSRVVLFADTDTDYTVLEEVSQTAWASLPEGSPNAGLRQPVLTILNAARKFQDSRRALHALLLRASCAGDSGEGPWSAEESGGSGKEEIKKGASFQ